MASPYQHDLCLWYIFCVTTSLASLYDWLVLVHVLAAMVWLGSLVILAAFALRILRGGEPEETGRFLGALRVIGPLALAPAPITLVAAGLAAVGDSDAWDFGQRWVQLGIVLFAAAFVVGAAHQSRAAIGAERAAKRGDHAEAAAQLRRWAWGTAVMVALLVLATWDMVFKPT
jgi:uncharacterized membrane protein